MTDFEIEKTMITGMVKSLFKGVRVVSDPGLVDEGSFKNFSIGVVTVKRC